MPAKSPGSKRWLREHFSDAWVKRRHANGYRSRAAYKLLQIQARDRLVKRGMTVVDLGAAPGGWSQVAAELAGPRGRVLANDVLPLDALPGVEFVQGDCTETAVLEKLTELAGGAGADLVISDMAPNISGVRDADQARTLHLAELALELAHAVLKPGGAFLVKLFQGAGFEEFRAELGQSFRTVKVRKPDASRARSREIYLLAAEFIG